MLKQWFITPFDRWIDWLIDLYETAWYFFRSFFNSQGIAWLFDCLKMICEFLPASLKLQMSIIWSDVLLSEKVFFVACLRGSDSLVGRGWRGSVLPWQESMFIIQVRLALCIFHFFSMREDFRSRLWREEESRARLLFILSPTSVVFSSPANCDWLLDPYVVSS